MNEQSWRQIWPYLAIPQQFPWSSRWREWPQTTAWVSGDVSLFWRRRRDNIHTPPNAHHQRPLSPRGPAVAAGRGFSWFSGSWGLRWIFVIWQKKNNQALIMASLSTRTLCLPIFPSWNIYIYTMNLPEPFLSFVRSGWHVVKLFAALYGHKTPHEHTKAIWTKQNNATVLYSDQLNDSYDYKL